MNASLSPAAVLMVSRLQNAAMASVTSGRMPDADDPLTVLLPGDGKEVADAELVSIIKAATSRELKPAGDRQWVNVAACRAHLRRWARAEGPC